MQSTSCPLDYVFIIPQANRKVNTFLKKFLRQIAQIREKDQAKVCAICLLTFCVPCGIMEIRLAATAHEPPILHNKKEVGGYPPPLLDVNFDLFPFFGKVLFNLILKAFTHSVKNLGSLFLCKIKNSCKG